MQQVTHYSKMLLLQVMRSLDTEDPVIAKDLHHMSELPIARNSLLTRIPLQAQSSFQNIKITGYFHQHCTFNSLYLLYFKHSQS